MQPDRLPQNQPGRQTGHPALHLRLSDPRPLQRLHQKQRLLRLPIKRHLCQNRQVQKERGRKRRAVSASRQRKKRRGSLLIPQNPPLHRDRKPGLPAGNPRPLRQRSQQRQRRQLRPGLRTQRRPGLFPEKELLLCRAVPLPDLREALLPLWEGLVYALQTRAPDRLPDKPPRAEPGCAAETDG